MKFPIQKTKRRDSKSNKKINGKIKDKMLISILKV